MANTHKKRNKTRRSPALARVYQTHSLAEQRDLLKASALDDFREFAARRLAELGWRIREKTDRDVDWPAAGDTLWMVPNTTQAWVEELGDELIIVIADADGVQLATISAEAAMLLGLGGPTP